MITKTSMGTHPTGAEIFCYTLTNAAGAYVEVSTLGGSLMRVCVPDREGRLGDVTLGYTTVDALLSARGYMGALIGRFGNRIGGAAFTLGDKTYALAKNDGENHLHGGIAGFDKYIWQAAVRDDALALSILSPDGDEGYPGALSVTVTYTLTDDNALGIRYEAVCDRDTILNLTNHVYFNLSGPACESVGDHLIQINADAFTEVSDPACIPTGRLVPVDGTPFDLRAPRKISEGLSHQAENVQMRYGNGYDHNFAIRGWSADEGGWDPTMRLAAVVTDPASGRRMETWTDQPGVQFYGGNSISGDVPGKCGVPYKFRQGLCLETQHYPDSIHHAAFPSCVLRKGEKYDTKTEYRFFAE